MKRFLMLAVGLCLLGAAPPPAPENPKGAEGYKYLLKRIADLEAKLAGHSPSSSLSRLVEVRRDGEKWGTGSVVRGKYVLTAGHAVAEGLTVDGIRPTVVAHDREHDLAVLCIHQARGNSFEPCTGRGRLTSDLQINSLAGNRRVRLVGYSGLNSRPTHLFVSGTAQPGESGSPLLCEGRIAGVLTHTSDSNMKFAAGTAVRSVLDKAYRAVCFQ